MTTIEQFTTTDALIAQSQALRAEFAAFVEDLSHAMANLRADVEHARGTHENKS